MQYHLMKFCEFDGLRGNRKCVMHIIIKVAVGEQFLTIPAGDMCYMHYKLSLWFLVLVPEMEGVVWMLLVFGTFPFSSFVKKTTLQFIEEEDGFWGRSVIGVSKSNL